MPNYYDFPAVQTYTLGCGAIKELFRLTRGYGRRYLIILDRHAKGQIARDIQWGLDHPSSQPAILADNLIGRAPGLLDSLQRPQKDTPPAPEYQFFSLTDRVCCQDSARRLGQIIRDSGAQIVVAVGGSKCQDLVRAALHFVGDGYLRPKLVLCPTVLASNASTNGMSVLYDQDGRQMTDFWSLPLMPECVIVDTGLLIQTPVATFVAGIGDQLASSVEALHTLKATGEATVCDPLCIAHHQAVLEVLMRHSAAAVQAMRRGEITPEFEWVCHALTRYTGPQLAVATSYFAHILDEALIAIPAVAQRMHGEVVAFGVLAEMAVFGTPERIRPLAALYRQIGLPTTLTELGAENCRQNHGKPRTDPLETGRDGPGCAGGRSSGSIWLTGCVP